MNNESDLDGEPKQRVELRDAQKAMEAGDFASVITLGKQYFQAADSELVLEAKKVVSLALFHKESYTEAFELFQEIAKITDEVSDWFNVVTSATLSGRISLGEQAFEQAIRVRQESVDPEQPSLPLMRHYYACALRDKGEFEKAFGQIEQLRLIYEKLKITDTTFLYMRGVPLLSQTMDVAADVFVGLGDSFDVNQWIDSFAAKLDEEGSEYLKKISKRI